MDNIKKEGTSHFRKLIGLPKPYKTNNNIYKFTNNKNTAAISQNVLKDISWMECHVSRAI